MRCLASPYLGTSPDSHHLIIQPNTGHGGRERIEPLYDALPFQLKLPLDDGNVFSTPHSRRIEI